MALETNVDRELCVQAADRALAYLRERVLDDTWVAAHRDVAYYFKTPQAFLVPGLPLMFYEVDHLSQDPQLYFMLAFPAMVLLELHAQGQDENRLYQYAVTAGRLLAFLRSCDGISGSLFAHKAAVAAAMEPIERDLAAVISQYLVSQQRAHGGFADDADAMDTVDQTAELACWLRMLPELAAATEPVSWAVAGF